MRTVAAALLVAVVTVPAAVAKGRITLGVSDRTPGVGETFAVDVRTGFVVPPNDWLRLVAVAPGKNLYQVVGAVTGDSSRTHADISRDGFETKLTRVTARHWRALMRLPRSGRWRIVVPNGTHVGFVMPPPAEWIVSVEVHR